MKVGYGENRMPEMPRPLSVTYETGNSGLGQVQSSANECLGAVTLALPPDAVCRVENSATGWLQPFGQHPLAGRYRLAAASRRSD